MDFDLSKMNDEQRLYYHMHHALEKAKRMKQKSIFLLGQIRSGKSTTMNWIKDPESLIGDGSGLKLFYSILNKNDKSLAAIDNKFSSVTLVQNMISILDNYSEVSLIDLPGFNENRT